MLRRVAAHDGLGREFAGHVVDDIVIPVLSAHQKGDRDVVASLDKQALEQFNRRFEALFNAGDAAGMAACYTEDARLLAENTECLSPSTPPSGSVTPTGGGDSPSIHPARTRVSPVRPSRRTIITRGPTTGRRG